MKTLFARWIASRLEKRARILRRCLRDFQRQETIRIGALEQRSRGLRLYIAWTRNSRATPAAPVRLSLPEVAIPIFSKTAKSAA